MLPPPWFTVRMLWGRCCLFFSRHDTSSQNVWFWSHQTREFSFSRSDYLQGVHLQNVSMHSCPPGLYVTLKTSLLVCAVPHLWPSSVLPDCPAKLRTRWSPKLYHFLRLEITVDSLRHSCRLEICSIPLQLCFYIIQSLKSIDNLFSKMCC